MRSLLICAALLGYPLTSLAGPMDFVSIDVGCSSGGERGVVAQHYDYSICSVPGSVASVTLDVAPNYYVQLTATSNAASLPAYEGQVRGLGLEAKSWAFAAASGIITLPGSGTGFLRIQTYTTDSWEQDLGVYGSFGRYASIKLGGAVRADGTYLFPVTRGEGISFSLSVDTHATNFDVDQSVNSLQASVGIEVKPVDQFGNDPESPEFAEIIFTPEPSSALCTAAALCSGLLVMCRRCWQSLGKR